MKMASGPPYYCPSCNISRNMTGIREGVSRAHECTLCRVSVNKGMLTSSSAFPYVWSPVHYVNL